MGYLKKIREKLPWFNTEEVELVKDRRGTYRTRRELEERENLPTDKDGNIDLEKAIRKGRFEVDDYPKTEDGLIDLSSMIKREDNG